MKAASIVYIATAFLCIVAGGIALSGCAEKLMSDSHISDTTAMALNLPASAVTISDRRYDGMTDTYYTAQTPKGSYSCKINGGTVMALGVANLPECSPRQSGVVPDGSTIRRLRNG